MRCTGHIVRCRANREMHCKMPCGTGQTRQLRQSHVTAVAGRRHNPIEVARIQDPSETKALVDSFKG
eukprot:2511693-Rhodomonas_salina.2